jgi:hypothetical protein
MDRETSPRPGDFFLLSFHENAPKCKL